MDKECFELIKEIKNSVPRTYNLSSNVEHLEKFAYVQELIILLSDLELDQPFESIIQTFKDFFHPILLSTVSYEADFIRMVEPILRYPELSLHAADVVETKLQLSIAFSYHSVLNKLIHPTVIERQIGELLFLKTTNSDIGLKQTRAITILFNDLPSDS